MALEKRLLYLILLKSIGVCVDGTKTNMVSCMSKTYCIFSANYLPNIGGVEKYTQNLAFALEKTGNKAVIVTNNCFNLPAYEEVSPNISIYRLPCFPLFNGRLPLPKKNREYKKLIKKINNEAIDYVTINTRFYPHTFTGIKIAENKNIKPIVIDHGSAYLTFGNRMADIFVIGWEHFATKLLKRHSIDFYGVSSASTKWLNTFNIEAKGVLCNAIDSEEFINNSSSRNFKNELNLEDSSFIVVFTGRFIPEKGIDCLIKAAKLTEDEKNIHFLLAGDGPMLQKVKAEKGNNVHLLGKINASDISALLQAADVYCSPTRSEGFSTSLLEAAACATTPIITNVGGVEELLTGGNKGIILNSMNPEEVSQSILSLFNNRKRCREMGINLQAYVKNNFSWSNTALSVIDASKEAQK